ncbi:MAG: hypothetical protein R3F17_12335 [Planctomycetota bacterium]
MPHMRLCVLPVPNPDLLWQEQAAGTGCFPWTVDMEGPGQGAPLCRETRSLVAWFLRHSEVAWWCLRGVGPRNSKPRATRTSRGICAMCSVCPAWTPGGPVGCKGRSNPQRRQAAARPAWNRCDASGNPVRVDLKLHNGGPERFVGPAPSWNGR